ncbi:TPA: hypothetical protein DDW35_04035, partial [Candidatus Sumerlaeota bacterium]|nr:hypothetical protein [Candidatus Sumerlaeota bacterium]
MSVPAACFFDMDNTLMANDCDVSWKDFLIAEGVAAPDERANSDRQWHAYLDGIISEEAFVSFQLRQFAGKTPDEMGKLTRKHFETVVRPRIYPQAQEAICAALAHGAVAVLLTATHRPVAQPVADYLGMTDAICTEAELCDGRYTGRLAGRYNILDRKVESARAWLSARGLSLDQCAYYGDSEHD